MTYLQKLKKLNQMRGQGKHAERICSELSYLDGVSKNRGGAFDARIEEAADMLLDLCGRDGVITLGAVKRAEEMLADLGPAAKSYTELFISHAHIDMNWMWGYNETAAVTVDTFRTVIGLMRDFPEMTFGQSQASTYEIIEKYAPEMLGDIKRLVHEGRWEVNAAEWVEPDKNMPDGESLTRQILQTKKYLSRLLGIDPDSLDVDFVPDTFGHNVNVPEILCDAGIKYMYHCRGHKGPCLYYYKSPSGKKTLNYREYVWYNGEISPEKFEIVPDFCAKEKVNTYLCVFGVGDHGGGPSRRDIERITEYMTWPLAPTIRFGTVREFFRAAENSGTEFPTVDSELNVLFTGCYTTQTRIKMANRISEARINEAEELSAAASLLAGAPREPDRLDGAWRNILFNHFHDIIPGSGTIETREFAMGRFQETLAYVGTYASLSMRRIAEAADTTCIPFEDAEETVSEGGGAGFYQDQSSNYRFPAAERGRGSVRAFMLFNTTSHDRDEFAEITVWDYREGFENAVFTDADKNELPFIPLSSGEGYWGHRFSKVLVKARVPAFGYSTVILSQRAPEGHFSAGFTSYEKRDDFINDAPVVLESDLIKAVFDKTTMHLVSLTDKRNGKALIEKPSCFFRLADENPIYGMTSWRVGPLMNVTDLNAVSDVRFTDITSNDVYSKISYELKFGSSGSRVDCDIVLKRDSDVLEFNVRIDWNEYPVRGEKVPQISFAVPVSYKNTGKCVCDIPYGTIKRESAAHDVPCLSYIYIEGEDGCSAALITDSKYGYRAWDGTESVTLIRSSYDPDPYPDRGIHNIRIGIAAVGEDGAKKASDLFNHPMSYIPLCRHEGTIGLTGSILWIDGSVEVSCVKNSEDGTGVAVRLFETRGKDAHAVLAFNKDAKDAVITDTNEIPVRPAVIKDGSVEIDVPAYSAATVVVRF